MARKNAEYCRWKGRTKRMLQFFFVRKVHSPYFNFLQLLLQTNFYGSKTRMSVRFAKFCILSVLVIYCNVWTLDKWTKSIYLVVELYVCTVHLQHIGMSANNYLYKSYTLLDHPSATGYFSDEDNFRLYCWGQALYSSPSVTKALTFNLSTRQTLPPPQRPKARAADLIRILPSLTGGEGRLRQVFMKV